MSQAPKRFSSQIGAPSSKKVGATETLRGELEKLQATEAVMGPWDIHRAKMVIFHIVFPSKMVIFQFVSFYQRASRP